MLRRRTGLDFACFAPQGRVSARGGAVKTKDITPRPRAVPGGSGGFLGIKVSSGALGAPVGNRANFAILGVRDFACFCGSKYAPSM